MDAIYTLCGANDVAVTDDWIRDMKSRNMESVQMYRERNRATVNLNEDETVLQFSWNTMLPEPHDRGVSQINLGV